MRNDKGYVRPSIFPPGFVGDLAEYIYRAAPYPNATIALVGALGLIAGFSGRAFNVGGQGLNLYLLVLAPTGTGKEAIADAYSRLIAILSKQNPELAKFRGPGELISGPGLLKWLAKLRHPVFFSVIGEFGLMLKAMASPKNPIMLQLGRVLIHLYEKSGSHGYFDAAAYSDPDKKMDGLKSPSVTIIGEGVPDTFYSTISTEMLTSGLLSRLSLFETNEPRPYENFDRQLEPSPQIIDTLAIIAKDAAMLADIGSVREVTMDAAGDARFKAFSDFATDQLRGAGNEATRHLWNRAATKAKKIAAILAIGRDPQAPRITHDDCMWATSLIDVQTRALIAKFDRGEVGDLAGNEANQQSEVIRVAKEYLLAPFEKYEKYGVQRWMRDRYIIPYCYFSRRLIKLPTFAEDRVGASNALKRALDNLREADELKEFPKHQAMEQFKTGARLFMVNPERFNLAADWTPAFSS